MTAPVIVPQVGVWRRRFEVAARFTRIFSMGATVLYVIVGLATSVGGPSAELVVGVIGIGVAFHIYADVSNDVMDLPLDRTTPRRAPWPLVQGIIGPPQALLAAIVGLTAAYGVVASLSGSGAAAVALSTAAGLIGLYNLFGKRVPIAGDLVQGLGWAALVALGAALGGGSTDATVWAMAFVVAYVAMVNGVHGALRDVTTDAAAGARTTAIALGARERGEEGWWVPVPLVAYASVLQTAAWLALAGLIRALDLTGWRLAVAGGVTVGLQVVVATLLVAAYRMRGDPGRAMALGTWHLFLLPAGLLVASVGRLPWWAQVLTVAAFVVPPLVFAWAVSGSDPRPEVPATQVQPASATGARHWGAVWRMCRPVVCLAAGGLTALGALLATPLLPEAVAAVAAATLIVAASNVFNDRCDVVADRVNRPDRPLATGYVSPSEADRVVLGLGVAGIVAASPLGAAAAAWAAALLTSGMAYSALLRRSPWMAPLTVAVVFSATVPYGGRFAGRALGLAHVVAAVQVLLFVLAREILKAVPDRRGDVIAGYATLPMRLGRDTALGLFHAGAVVYAAAVAVLPVALGLGDSRYLVVAAALAVGPVAAAVWKLRRDRSDEAVRSALALTSVVLVTGLVPLTLLGHVP